jgi:RHS repeat-associated protein
MDQFTYGYGTTSNRLLNVADAAGITSNTDDIEPGQVANNYQYDLLGQLIKDIQEGIVYYDWRLSDRKLRSITGASTKADVNFIYNPFGQRVVKIVKPKVNGVVDKQSNWIYTYYSYDANGQVMAVYDCKLDGTNATLNQATLKEQHLYGSQRLGMVNKNTLLYQSNTAYTTISPLVQNTYGNTNYELNNHLGNVNAVITDRRFWNNTTLKHEAGVEMKNDYYPFGMAMKGRQLNPVYRFGYNGMEVDNEVSGNGNSYSTEFRQYDPRLGRWKSLDPLMAQFPWQSPYCAFDNNPVFYNDPLGLAANGGDSTKTSMPPTSIPKDAKVGDTSEDGNWGIGEDGKGGLRWTKIGDLKEIKVTPNSKSEAAKSEHIKSTKNSIMSQFLRGSGRGKISFQLDKSSPYYNDRLKMKNRVDDLGKIAVGNLTIPLVIIAGAEVAPLLANPWVASAIEVNTEYWGIKAGISAGSQALLNDGKVNLIGVFTDATLGFGSSSVIQSSLNFEYDFLKDKTEIKYLGNGISSRQFLLGSSVGILFGSKSEGLNNLLNTTNSKKGFNSFLSNTLYSLPSNGINAAYEKSQKKP